MFALPCFLLPQVSAAGIISTYAGNATVIQQNQTWATAPYWHWVTIISNAGWYGELSRHAIHLQGC